MQYLYEELVDWGIIRRQWRTEVDDILILLEMHEEDRFTVTLSHKRKGLLYYSFHQASGKLTFATLEEAMEHAAYRVKLCQSETESS